MGSSARAKSASSPTRAARRRSEPRSPHRLVHRSQKSKYRSRKGRRGHASSESSDSDFGGRRRSEKVRERFAEQSEETRGILQHWKLEEKKRKDAQYMRGVEMLDRLTRIEEAKHQ